MALFNDIGVKDYDFTNIDSKMNYICKERLYSSNDEITCKVKSKKIEKYFIVKILKTKLSKEDIDNYIAKLQACNNYYLSSISKALLKDNLLFTVRPYYEIYSADIHSPDIERHLIEIGEGLLELHNNKIIHSNLTPSNILYDKVSDKIKICDYGLIYIRKNNVKKKETKYLSPEELSNKELDISVDKWNYGLLLYKYIIGEDLFKDEDVDKIMRCEYEVSKDSPYMLKEILKLIIEKEVNKRIEICKIIELLKKNQEPKVYEDEKCEAERIFEEIGIKMNHPINPLPVQMTLNDYFECNRREEMKSTNENINFIVGIDFGGNNYVLSGYDNRIEPIVPKIIEDVYSQKKTQLFIDMTNNRLFGKSTTAVKNFKNVITTIKDLFGKKFSEISEILKNHSHYPESIIELENDEIGFKIHNIGLGEKILNVNDIYSSYANHIYEYIKEKNNMDKIKCILSVPCDYNNYQIELLRRIFESNGFKKVEIIPEYLSCSLCFGYENDSKFVDEESKKKVLFVDMGYLKTNICLNEYGKNEVKIIQTKTINDLCGMRIDNILINHFREMIKDEMKIDIFEVGKEKNYLKVKNEIIKMKEKLSAQGASDINVSIDLGDDDFDSTFSVNELNDLVKKNGIDKELKEGIKAVLNESKISNEEKRLIEVVIVGGSLRIPLLQTTIEEYLKSIENEIKINRTINMDEDISYGNSYYGLIEEGKWKYRIVNEDNEDVMNNIISIPQSKTESLLICLNYLMLNMKRKKIKEDDKEILRQMDDCINDEMNKLKCIIDREEINVDEMKKRIERIESKLKDNNTSTVKEFYTVIKIFSIVLSGEIVKDGSLNQLIRITEGYYNYIHNEIEILFSVGEIVKQSRKNEIEFYDYDKNYGIVMKKRNDLESSIYDYQRAVKSIDDKIYQSIAELSNYLNNLIIEIHSFVRIDKINDCFKEIQEKYSRIKDDFENDFNELKTESSNSKLPIEMKNELNKLVNNIPSQLPDRIEDIYRIYLNAIPQYKTIIKNVKHLFIRYLYEICDILPEIEKQIPKYIKIDTLKVIVESSIDNVKTSFNTLKDIYEIKSNIELESKPIIKYYIDNLTKLQKEINENMKLLKGEDMTRMKMQSFHNDHTNNQSNNDITTIFNFYSAYLMDYDGIVEETKKRVEKLCDDYEKEINTIKLKSKNIDSFKTSITNIKSGLKKENKSLKDYCKYINELSNDKARLPGMIKTEYHNYIHGILSEIKDYNKPDEILEKLESYLNGRMKEQQTDLVRICNDFDECKTEVGKNLIEKKNKLKEIINKHKSDVELIKNKMDSKDELLKIIEESIPKLNEDYDIGFKEIMNIEKEIQTQVDIIISFYKNSFNKYCEDIEKQKDKIKDEEKKRKIDDVLKQKEEVNRNRSIKEVFDLNNKAFIMKNSLILISVNHKQERIKKLLNTAEENKAYLGDIMKDINLNKIKDFSSKGYKKEAFNSLNDINKKIEEEIEKVKEIIISRIAENINKTKLLLEKIKNEKDVKTIIEKYNEIDNVKHSATKSIIAFVDVEKMKLELADRLYTELTNKKENMKLIIESVEKDKELFNFITEESLKIYKSYYDKLLNMKKPFSSITFQNLVNFKVIHTNKVNEIKKNIEKYYEIFSITIDSLTFINKEERDKQKKQYTEKLIKEIIPKYIEYCKSNNCFYDLIKTRKIDQLKELNKDNVVNLYDKYNLKELENYKIDDKCDNYWKKCYDEIETEKNITVERFSKEMNITFKTLSEIYNELKNVNRTETTNTNGLTSSNSSALNTNEQNTSPPEMDNIAAKSQSNQPSNDDNLPVEANPVESHANKDVIANSSTLTQTTISKEEIAPSTTSTALTTVDILKKDTPVQPKDLPVNPSKSPEEKVLSTEGTRSNNYKNIAVTQHQQPLVTKPPPPTKFKTKNKQNQRNSLTKNKPKQEGKTSSEAKSEIKHSMK